MLVQSCGNTLFYFFYFFFWESLGGQPVIECTPQPKHNISNDSLKNPWALFKLPFCYLKAISSNVRQPSKSVSQKTCYPSANWFARDLEEKAVPFSLQLHDTDCVSDWICQYFHPCCLINIFIFKKKSN